MAEPVIPPSLVAYKCYQAPPEFADDIRGNKYGRLTAIGFGHVTTQRKAWWWFECDCGARILLCKSQVMTGHTRSCGCIRRETAGHHHRIKQRRDKSCPKIYTVFNAMMERCYRASNARFKDYGGRGIFICDEWLRDRSAFIRWSKQNGYGEGLQIDRIDNDGPYSPENCRWVSSFVNMNNTRRNKFIEYNGERLTIMQWARKLGMGEMTFRSRLERGWSMEKIAATPVGTRVAA